MNMDKHKAEVARLAIADLVKSFRSLTAEASRIAEVVVQLQIFPAADAHRQALLEVSRRIVNANSDLVNITEGLQKLINMQGK